MVEVEKEEKHGKFTNIKGHDIIVYIIKTPIHLRVAILSPYKWLGRKCMVLLLLVTIDSIFLLSELTPMYIVFGFLFLSLLLFYSICWTTIQETLIIMNGLGVQIETKYAVGSKSVFIPQDQVQRIFINEVIWRNRVVFILTFLIKNENAKEILIPLFVETLPKLSALKVVFCYITSIDIIKS